MKLLIINGVNLCELGKRELDIYGGKTLDEINSEVAEYAGNKGIDTEFFTSNLEGDICSVIANNDADGIIINGGAYSHYSIAIRDAIAGINKPCVEVHMSNVYAREDFRKVSVIAPKCVGYITGFLEKGYMLAVEYFALGE